METVAQPAFLTPEADNDDDGDTLARVKRMFTEFRDATEEARRESEIDVDYYNNHQWTDAEKAELRRRNQPIITINRVQPMVDAVAGIEERAETQPKAWPRTPKDAKAAEVATDTLRYVVERARFDPKRIAAFKDIITPGTGGFSTEVEKKGSRIEITVRRLRWENIVYDPYARELDFSDARYLGEAKWMDREAAVAFFKGRGKDAIEATLGNPSTMGEAGSGSLEDRPNTQWVDTRRKRLMLVELYYLGEDGTWLRCIFTGGGFIESPAPSPYLDEEGQPSCPIDMQSAFVDRENRRYGLVRMMRGPQDEVNHRRSRFLHLLNSRQTFATKGAIATQDPRKVKRELQSATGHVELNPGKVWGQDAGIVPTQDMAEGQALLLQEAKNEIDRFGNNAALRGRGTEDQSGRAILAQQQAGLAELGTLFGGLNDLTLRVYRQIWARAKQFWQGPMWVRVTDDLGAPKFIQVNEPVVDEMGNPQMTWQAGPDGQPVAIPVLRNRLAEMDVDLIIDHTPLSANIQAEQFSELVELAKNGMPIPPEAIVQASSLRNKRQIVEAIEKQRQAGGPPPEVAQVAIQSEVAKIEKERAAANKANADAEQTRTETAMMGAAALAPVIAPPNLSPGL